MVKHGGTLKIFLLTVLAVGFFACRSTPPPPGESEEAEVSEGELSPQGDAERSYRILKEGRKSQDNWLDLNEYIFIHYLYTDILERFGLYSSFTLGDKIRIVAGILYNLDFEAPVNLVIDNYKDEGSLVVSLQLIRIGEQPSILLATNTDRAGGRIYVGMENLAKTYKRSYVIVNDRLVALTDLYSERKESELIEDNSADRLASFYIFDGNTSNDTVAEALLIGSIRGADTWLQRCRSQLILSRYYMSRDRLEEAQALLIGIGRYVASPGAEDTLLESYSIAWEELLITSALKAHEERLRSTRPKPL
jgi:hypothetical protein